MEADRRSELPAQDPHPAIIAAHLETDFVPDGDLSKRAWSGAESVRFSDSFFDGTSYPEIATTVCARWSPGYLYLAFWCPYQILNVHEGEDPARERWELWERDVVEAFLNPQPRRSLHYYEFEVAPNNQWLDLEIDLERTPRADRSWHSGFEHAARIDASNRVWSVEMRIPVASMGVERISPGDAWKVNFYRCDGSGDGMGRRMMGWSPRPTQSTGHSFHEPASFGTLRFADPGRWSGRKSGGPIPK